MPAISNLKRVCVLLKPFKDATDLISAEKYVTSSLILPLQDSLLSKTAPDYSDPGMVSTMKSLIYNDLEPRYVFLRIFF